MNNLLHLKGKFEKKGNNCKPGSPKLPKNTFVEAKDIDDFIVELNSIYERWRNDFTIRGALISVHYKKIVAKSNRIAKLLEGNNSVVGAKFNEYSTKHIFTHFVSLDVLYNSISDLKKVSRIIKLKYKGIIYSDDIEKINEEKKEVDSTISRTKFVGIVVDCFYVECFKIDEDKYEIKEAQIVTLYRTAVETRALLKSFGIDIISSRMIDDCTMFLNKNELELLYSKAPYLISMRTNDLSQLDISDIKNVDKNGRIVISKPTNEPLVGVIDTMFDTNVYFSEWVDFVKMIPDEIEITQKDYNHGTEVTSIIVDGQTLNPNLDDGCGRFKVKHFGVATAGHFSSFAILRSIREIVAKNPNIKVWNLSLGSSLPISSNFISPEAAELDRIQCENDCVFIIAGTNKLSDISTEILGAPADSLNSIVVNSVKRDGKAASYTRRGPVLSFFQKPDISYYGGDAREYIRVCSPLGEGFVSGTSYAAPWITRKIAYMIHRLGLTREIAKAILIDSAADWNNKRNYEIGYGIVPINIHDVIQSKDDEIKFMLTGTAEEYETYTYNIPVPKNNEHHPYYARATLCYFPRCSRNQGVDYTNTEVDIHFGRVVDDEKIYIKSINNNVQDEDNHKISEDYAREIFRKWDNVKHISEEVKVKRVPKKIYGNGLWGLSVKVKERLATKIDKRIQFGIVITLKEMNGINRIQSFIDECRLKGWIVNRIEVNNKIDIYNKSEETINWD